MKIPVTVTFDLEGNIKKAEYAEVDANEVAKKLAKGFILAKPKEKMKKC